MVEAVTFVDVQCVGMIGKLPTPEGECLFWDTGKKITIEQTKILKSLQWQACYGNRKEQTHAWDRLKTIAQDIATAQNVYPPKYAGLTDDGRIVVNTPWFKTKEG